MSKWVKEDVRPATKTGQPGTFSAPGEVGWKLPWENHHWRDFPLPTTTAYCSQLHHIVHHFFVATKGIVCGKKRRSEWAIVASSQTVEEAEEQLLLGTIFSSNFPLSRTMFDTFPYIYIHMYVCNVM